MANDFTASIPQFWAVESLRFLMAKAAAVMSVNRQFAPRLAAAGTQVNAWRCAKRKTRRKTQDDENSEKDASLIPVPVVLDQYFFDSVMIKDQEEALSLPELTRLKLVPMLDTIVNGVERAILGRVHAFLRYGTPRKRAGKLRGMTKDNAADYILEAEEVLIDNLAPMDGLVTAIVHHTANTKLMRSDLFTRVDQRGQDQANTRTGEVGVVYNTRVVVSQYVNYAYAPNTDNQIGTSAEAQPAGYAGSISINDPGQDPTVGEYFVFEENGQPTFVTAATLGTAVTLNEELKFAITSGGAFTHYLKGTTDAVVYPVGYQKFLTVNHNDGKGPQKGQLVSFGTGGARHNYTVIEIDNEGGTSTDILLDRPLKAQVNASAEFYPGPAGSLNPVLHEDAIAFVSRPMQAKRNGATSAVANMDGIGIRVQMQDDLLAGGTRMVVDLLAGVSVLDEDLLCVMCA